MERPSSSCPGARARGTGAGRRGPGRCQCGNARSPTRRGRSRGGWVWWDNRARAGRRTRRRRGCFQSDRCSSVPRWIPCRPDTAGRAPDGTWDPASPAAKGPERSPRRPRRWGRSRPPGWSRVRGPCCRTSGARRSGSTADLPPCTRHRRPARVSGRRGLESARGRRGARGGRRGTERRCRPGDTRRRRRGERPCRARRHGGDHDR